MKETEFRVKSYSKLELARMYNPLLCDRTAQRTLLKWIEHNASLRACLKKLGFKSTDRIFTPKQVGAMVEYLGEP